MQFFKLNTVSFLYALALFIAVEFMLKVANIDNLTSDERMIVNSITILTFLVVVLGTGIALAFLTKKWFGKQKVRFWTSILWIPYLALFVLILTQVFPGNASPSPTNSSILYVLIGTLILYPIYIVIVNLLK